MSDHKHPLGVVAQLDEGEIKEFDDDLRGDLIFPDNDEYADARNVWNGLINKYPAIVARVKGATDVATALQFAQENDLEFSIRGGAHHQAGSAIVEGGLVIDLEDMDAIRINPDEKIANVQPGTRVEDVLAEAQPYGLAMPTGSAGDNGMPGSTLGGGIGWMRRSNGLGIDALRSIELVTANGEVVKASPDKNEELFWAIRGGGGNFGVVTNFEFDLYEVGPLVQGLGIFYPADAAEDVLETYKQVTDDAPEEFTSILLHSHVPGLPPMPDELIGEEAVCILGCWDGSPEDGEEFLEPLRNVTEPLLDMSDVMPYELLHDLGTQMFPWGRKYCHRSVYVDELNEETLDIIHEQREAAPAPMNGIAIWDMGGNIGHGGDLSYPWADKEYMIVVESNWEDYDNVANLEWARETEKMLRDAGGEGAYGGFTGVEEQEWEDWSEQVYSDNYDRLAEVKAEYDPDNVFSLNINVDPNDA